MLQKIDYNIRLIAEEFGCDTWALNNMQSSYISFRPRNNAVILGGGVLMWSIILVGYFLMSLPYVISLPLVVVSGFFYCYFSFPSRQRHGFIQFRQHNDVLVCIGAIGLDCTRIKRLGAKYNMKVIFEKPSSHGLRFSNRCNNGRIY